MTSSISPPGLTTACPRPSPARFDRNGVEDRAYVGDSGGNVWRIELTGMHTAAPVRSLPATGISPQLAALGGSGDSDRRFFHAPDVVQSRDGRGV